MCSPNTNYFPTEHVLIILQLFVAKTYELFPNWTYKLIILQLFVAKTHELFCNWTYKCIILQLFVAQTYKFSALESI